MAIIRAAPIKNSKAPVYLSPWIFHWLLHLFLFFTKYFILQCQNWGFFRLCCWFITHRLWDAFSFFDDEWHSAHFSGSFGWGDWQLLRGSGISHDVQKQTMLHCRTRAHRHCTRRRDKSFIRLLSFSKITICWFVWLYKQLHHLLCQHHNGKKCAK